MAYRHGYLGELLANAVFHDAPQVEGVIGLVRNAGPPLSDWLHLQRLGRLGIGCQGLFVKLAEGERMYAVRRLCYPTRI